MAYRKRIRRRFKRYGGRSRKRRSGRKSYGYLAARGGIRL